MFKHPSLFATVIARYNQCLIDTLARIDLIPDTFYGIEKI